MWTQNYTPVGGSLGLSALVAAIPILVLFVMLGVLRKPTWMAAAFRRRSPGRRLCWRPTAGLRHAGLLGGDGDVERCGLWRLPDCLGCFCVDHALSPRGLDGQVRDYQGLDRRADR